MRLPLPSAARAAAVVLLAIGAAVPAQADEPEFAGIYCGFATTNDETELVEQDPNVQFGEMHFGPLVAADVLADDGTGVSADPNATEVSVHCWIQVNDPVNDAAHHAAANAEAHCHAAGTGVVAPTVCPITYTALSTDNVYLCVAVYYEEGGVHKHIYRDGDPDTPEVQCRLAISAG